MGKDIESLIKSRDLRSEIKAKYGFIPTSIIEAEKNKLKSNDINANGSYYASEYFGESDRDHRLFGISGKGVGAGALSRYPQNIGRYLIKMYSNEGDTILDPFDGHNSRMELVYKLGRNYVGYDISHNFMEANRKEAKELKGEGEQTILFNQSNTITLVEKDSRELLERDMDMCLTSPPYYDIEWYGDETEQLGKCQTYEDFIDGITIILKRCYEALKPDKFCCWSINDFRRNGKFVPYHSDIIQTYLKVGFNLHDIIITDLGYPIGAAFASQLEEQKRTAKRHEYCIIGCK